MSYSLIEPCDDCDKKKLCTDRSVLYGAISGIHCMPFGVGHLGAGTITMNCFNKVQAIKTES